MNHLEYKLAGVVDALEKVDSFSRAEVRRVRDEAYTDENGETQYRVAFDVLGMGDKAAAIVDSRAVDGRRKARAVMVFSLQLLRDVSPRELADMLTPSLAQALEQAS